MVTAVALSCFIGALLGTPCGYLQRQSPSRNWLLGSEAHFAARSKNVSPKWFAAIVEVVAVYLLSLLVLAGVVVVFTGSVLLSHLFSAEPALPAVASMLSLLCGVALGRAMRKRAA